jgi:hypothetical protein
MMVLLTPIIMTWILCSFSFSYFWATEEGYECCSYKAGGWIQRNMMMITVHMMLLLLTAIVLENLRPTRSHPNSEVKVPNSEVKMPNSEVKVP